MLNQMRSRRRSSGNGEPARPMTRKDFLLVIFAIVVFVGGMLTLASIPYHCTRKGRHLHFMPTPKWYEGH